MKTFRNILFWAHLSAGVIASVIILVMSVTGVVLTYERQMVASADRKAYNIAPPTANATPVGVESLLEKVNSTQGRMPSSVTLRADAQTPAEVSYGRRNTLFVNPYTGQVLGAGAEGLRGFFGIITDWHRWIGLDGEGRDVGRAITGACNLAFLFLVVSGLYLWWPRNKTRAVWRSILWFKRGMPAKARDFNWHNVIGFWCLIPLFVLTLSGAVISYPWASNLVFRAVGETPPARRGAPGGGAERGGAERGGAERGGAERGNRAAGQGERGGTRGGADARGGGGGERGNGERERGAERGNGAVRDASNARGGDVSLAGLNGLMSRAQSQVPDWRSVTLRLPEGASEPVEFTIDSGTGGQPQFRSQLTLGRSNGQIVKWEPFQSQSLGRRLRSFLRFAHTGEYGGLIGQTLAGLASLGGVFLVWTGIALAWCRLRSWLKRRARKNETAPKVIEA